MSEATGRTELKHRLWGVGGRVETEGLADRRVLLTQAKLMPVNDTERRLWMKTRFNCTCQIFPVFQCNLSHFPHSCRSNAASSPLGAWLERRAHPGKEMGEDICKLTFLPKEGKQSLQWDCQCKGNRPETEQGEFGGWVGLLFFFLFLFQSNILFAIKVYSGCPKLPINLLKYFHQKLFLFTQVIHLKKMPWNTKTDFLKKIYFSPPPVCPVNWKKSIICSYSATGPRNPTEDLWSWHLSLTSSSVQDPQFQWHLPVSALSRNTYTTSARENYHPSWPVSININNCSYPHKCHVWPSLQRGLERKTEATVLLCWYMQKTLSTQLGWDLKLI